jgi:5'-3' exonuclease
MRLHVIDGTYELFRAHFSKRPPLTAPGSDVDVKGTVGVVGSLLALLGDAREAVTHVAVAFDNPIRSFRNDLFDDYKSDEGVPPEIRGQFDLVEEAVRAIGVTVWSMDRYEADDALATAAVKWEGACEQVRIMTPDKDLGQVVRGQKIVQVDRMRERTIDEEGVLAARGVPPRLVPDWLALVGDTADGIPGIAGFGEKTAATLVHGFGGLEAIPLDGKGWSLSPKTAARLATVLAENIEDARLYKRLATLVTDVPLAESLDDLAWRGVPRVSFDAFAERLGAETLRRRVPRWR